MLAFTNRSANLSPPLQQFWNPISLSVVLAWLRISRDAIAMSSHAHKLARAPHSNMAASKGVKPLLKAAKAAVGKKDYQEVSRICQVSLH